MNENPEPTPEVEPPKRATKASKPKPEIQPTDEDRGTLTTFGAVSFFVKGV
jgi:hypothetical protein